MAELEAAFAAQDLRFGRDLNRICCFPHVINIAVQAIIGGLPAAARQFREDSAAKGDEIDSETEAYLEALESCPVDVCRDLVRAMRSTNTRREGLRDTIREGNFHKFFKKANGEVLTLRVLELLRDSETRWSSTYNMILRYLELHPAIALCAPPQELLSAELTPTLALALPVYEALIQALYEYTFKFPELHHAITRGQMKLESYVVKTRDLPVYALAMTGAKVVVKEAMLRVRQRLHKEAAPTPLVTKPKGASERAASAQGQGYLQLLKLSSEVNRASELATDGRAENRQWAPVEQEAPAAPTLSATELLVRHMAEIDAKLLRWEQFEWKDAETLGTVGLVKFWKEHKHHFPLLYWVAMDVLPVQASSVSSERAFPSSKLTCTRERSRLSAESIEHLQVLKHSLHRRGGSRDDNPTLDFMSHVVNSPDEDDNEFFVIDSHIDSEDEFEGV